MRWIKLGSSVGCPSVPQVHFARKHFVRKQTMCKSVNIHLTVCFAFKSRAGFYTTLLTTRELCSANSFARMESDSVFKDGLILSCL